MYGEDFVWGFMDARILQVLDWMRERLSRRITINDYKWGGRFQNRGYRSNLYAKALYASQHLHGRAVDFVVEGMSVEEVHSWLEANKDHIPFPIWVEKKDGMTWVHIDVRQSNKKKIYWFGV